MRASWNWKFIPSEADSYSFDTKESGLTEAINIHLDGHKDNNNCQVSMID